MSEESDEAGSKKTGNVVIACGTGHIKMTGLPATIVQSSPRAWDAARVSVNSPSFRSETEAQPGGAISMSGSGRPDIGRPGEPRVAKVLLAVWKTAGIDARIDDGDDDRGVDRWLYLAGRRLVLQVTTIPSASDYWHSATLGFVQKMVGSVEAVLILRAAIEGKKPASSADTVLALDALHAGVFARAATLATYLDHFGCPSAEFGFASVWVVGPVADYVQRIGNGVP